MLMMLVRMGEDWYLRNYDLSDMQQFISEGNPVLVYDQDVNKADDFVEGYEDVTE